MVEKKLGYGQSEIIIYDSIFKEHMQKDNYEYFSD